MAARKAKKTVLKLESGLTIDKTPDILKNFKSLIAKNKALEIQSETIDSIDLTGIQLLILIKNMNSKELTIDFDLSFDDNAKDLITKCGYAKHLL